MFYGLNMIWDPTYYLVLIGLLICLIASAGVRGTMNKYSQVRNMANCSGEEAARRILDREGLHQVSVTCLNHHGGDHYDPRTGTVCLSTENYHGRSVTAVSVAAHECGHALQHAGHYGPLALRSFLVPIVNIGSSLGFPMILIGVLLGWNNTLIQIGIWAFALTVLFQLITLPVEFNASRRAGQKVEQYGLLGNEETRGLKKVLRAAAFTYVAAAASSILQLLRLMLLFGGRRRRD